MATMLRSGIVFAAGVLILCRVEAQVRDCNSNGIDDSLDLVTQEVQVTGGGECAPVELVAVDGLPGGQPVTNFVTYAPSGESALSYRPELGTLPLRICPPRTCEYAASRCGSALFRRGDSTGDGRADISDPIAVIGYLFLGGRKPGCLEAADAQNDGQVDIADAIYLLSFLFLSGPPPPIPFSPPSPCGADTDIRGTPGDLGCEEYASCSGAG